MNLEVPDWWSFVLLALASYRLWRLVGVDSITEPLRDWVTRVDEYHSGRPQNYREKLDELITCPWCLGFWISIGWWLFWVVWHQGAVFLAVPFAIGAVVGYLGKAD